MALKQEAWVTQVRFGRTVEILKELVAFPSVSATSNAAISQYLLDLLEPLGMECESLEYVDAAGMRKVSVVATTGPGTGGLVYCAHSDVVPVDGWEYPHSGPFDLHTASERFYGRGSCDMKGSLACFLTALETTALDRLRAPLSLICTADEEIGYLGAQYVAAHSQIYRRLVEQQPLTIIGEPTGLNVVHAHKGIYVFRVTSRGFAAHSSTDAGRNANLNMIPFLQEMLAIYEQTRQSPGWQDERFDPPSISWNIGINDFTHAANITPERSLCTVSFRPMPGQPATELVDRARTRAEQLGLEFELHHGAPPVFVEPQAPHIQELLRLTGCPRSRTVSYGTDAAMFDELQQRVVLGPGDIAQAHTVDEWISRDQLERGLTLNQELITHFCQRT